MSYHLHYKMPSLRGVFTVCQCLKRRTDCSLKGRTISLPSATSVPTWWRMPKNPRKKKIIDITLFCYDLRYRHEKRAVKRGLNGWIFALVQWYFRRFKMITPHNEILFCFYHHLHVCRYTYTAMLEVQQMIDTTWIMSPRPVVPWGLRKALNWVRSLSHCLFVLQTRLFHLVLYSMVKMLDIGLTDHFYFYPKTSNKQTE